MGITTSCPSWGAQSDPTYQACNIRDYCCCISCFWDPEAKWCQCWPTLCSWNDINCGACCYPVTMEEHLHACEYPSHAIYPISCCCCPALGNDYAKARNDLYFGAKAKAELPRRHVVQVPIVRPPREEVPDH